MVLTCWGSYGDLFPYLAIAIALRDLGHTPVVVSCPVYRELVEQEGIAFAPLRPDVRPDDTTLLRKLMDARRGTEAIVKDLLAPFVRQSYDDITAAAAGADVLVGHPVVFAGPLVAGRLGLPWLSSVLAPTSFFSAYDFPALPNAPWMVRVTALGPWPGRALMALVHRITRSWVAPVVALREELGLPPAPHPLFAGQFSPFANLALFSHQLGDPQRDWPARTQVTGFPFYNRAIPMPAEVSAFLDAGEPPVVFTLGSAAVSAAGSFYDESARAVAALGCRAVLLVGRHPENIPAHVPAGTLIVDSAPHDELFPRASVVVHQGGAGTTGQAMRSGRPQLVVPHAHDQPDNAHRVMRLGIAKVLSPTRYKAARVAHELHALIVDSRTAVRADEVGRQVRAEAGAEAAAAAILETIGAR